MIEYLKDKNNYYYVAIVLLMLALTIFYYTCNPSYKIFYPLFLILVAIIAYKDHIFCYSALSLLFTLEGSKLIINTANSKLSFLYYCVILIMIVYIILEKKKFNINKDLLKDKILIISSLILILNILSSIYSIRLLDSLKRSTSIFSVMFVFYFIPKYYFNKVNIKKMLVYFSWPIIVILTLAGIFNLLVTINFINISSLNKWEVPYCIYYNPNYYAKNIMIALIMIIVISVYLKNLKVSKLYIFIQLILLLNLYLTSSRAAFFVMIPIYVYVILKYYKRYIKKIIIVLIPIVIAMPIFFGKYLNIGMLNKTKANILTGRQLLWNRAFELLHNNFILGIGGSAFEALNNVTERFKGISVHNSFINLLVSYGIIASVLWCGIILSFFVNIYKQRETKVIIGIIILAMMAHGFVETTLFLGLSIMTSTFWIMYLLSDEKIKI